MINDPPKNVLKLARKASGERVEAVLGDAVSHWDAGCMGEVVVIGLGDKGEMFFQSSHTYKPDILWLLELAKKELLRAEDEDGDG